MENWIFFKSEYALYLLIGAWYFLQTPIFSHAPAYQKIKNKLFLFKKNANYEQNIILHYGKIVVAVIILIKIIKAFVLTVIQYYKFLPYLKPPYQPIAYYLGYIWTNFWLDTILTIFVSFLTLIFLKYLNNHYQKRFFYEEEYYFAGFGMLAIGWPFSLLYFSLVLFIGVARHVVKLISKINPVREQILREYSDGGIKAPSEPLFLQPPTESAAFSGGVKKINYGKKQSNQQIELNNASNASAEKTFLVRLSFYNIWLPLAICGTIIILLVKQTYLVAYSSHFF